MFNLAIQPNKPMLKHPIAIRLKSLPRLESINIFTMPSRIKDRDINAMFNGLIALIKEKVQQEQSERYLRLQLKYNRLQQLYTKTKNLLSKQNLIFRK